MYGLRETYRLRGYRGGWVPGLGVLNYYDLLAQANLQNCSPLDSACVSNNAAKEAAVEDFWAANQSTGLPDDTKLTFTPQTSQEVAEFYSGNPLIGGNVVDTRGIMSEVTGTPVKVPGGPGSPPPATQTGARGGQLSFTTSRGGSALQVGDTFSVAISGASPNSPVTVKGGVNGQSITTPMGSTDGAGNFSTSGAFTPDTVGSWQESWSVGGAPSGSFSFTVSPAAIATTPAGKVIINAPAGGAPVVPSGLPTIGGFDLSTVPWWAWAGAAGVAFLAFGGKR